MGMKPLAGWIGLCGVSIFLTGCGCCGQKKQPFMNGGADRSLGVTNRMTTPGWKDNPQSLATNGSGAASNGPGSPAAVPAARSFDSSSGTTPPITSSGNAGLGSSTPLPLGGQPAMSSGDISPMNNAPAPLTRPGMGTPLSSNDPALDATGRPSMSMVSPSPSGMPSSGVKQTSMSMASPSKVTQADFQSSNPVAGNIPPTTMNDMSAPGVVPPPPAPPSMGGSPSSVSASATPVSPWPPAASPPTPPPAPPVSMNSAFENPPPPVTVGAPSSTTGSSAKKSTGSFPPWANQ